MKDQLLHLAHIAISGSLRSSRKKIPLRKRLGYETAYRSAGVSHTYFFVCLLNNPFSYAL